MAQKTEGDCRPSEAADAHQSLPTRLQAPKQRPRFVPGLERPMHALRISPREFYLVWPPPNAGQLKQRAKISFRCLHNVPLRKKHKLVFELPKSNKKGRTYCCSKLVRWFFKVCWKISRLYRKFLFVFFFEPPAMWQPVAGPRQHRLWFFSTTTQT